MPKIKFALNNSVEDSDSDAEVKMLEMKYLNKNFNKWFKKRVVFFFFQLNIKSIDNINLKL